MWLSEFSYLVNQEADDTGMPGAYRIGYLYQTGAVKKFSGPTVDGNWCFYTQLEQMVYRPDDNDDSRGLSPFVALLFGPKEKNLFPFFYIAGLVFKGPFPERPKDSLNIGMAYGKYSSDLAETESQAGKPRQNFEAVFELNYWIQINQWCVFTPDFQFIVHPRGLDIPNAFCMGAQIGFIL
jgi:porin